MRKQLATITFLSILLFGGAILSFGQSTDDPSNTGQNTSGTTDQNKDYMKTGSMKATLSTTDKHFVQEAAIGGMAEVQLGQLGANSAQSEDVKEFANKMVTDHGKANDELKSLAEEKHIVLPKELDSKHQSTVTKLSKVTGANFDKEFMTEMVKDHVKDVAKFKEASSTAKDPDLKAWASKTLPTLEEHLTQAKTVAQKVGVDVSQFDKEGMMSNETKSH